MIRIYKYRLSQRVLLTALTSNKALLQCNYSESVKDYKLNVNRNAPDSVRDDRTAFDACKRHMRARTTVRFPALQFNAVNKQFVATRKVPQGASQPSEDRPSAAPVLDVKAVAQIAGSFSLT